MIDKLDAKGYSKNSESGENMVGGETDRNGNVISPSSNMLFGDSNMCPHKLEMLNEVGGEMSLKSEFSNKTNSESFSANSIGQFECSRYNTSDERGNYCSKLFSSPSKIKFCQVFP